MKIAGVTTPDDSRQYPTNHSHRSRSPRQARNSKPLYEARRIAHLQPVQWKEGSPLMGADGPDKIGEPVLAHRRPALPVAKAEALPASDEFTSSRLGLQWQWNANHKDTWHSLTARPDWLRLIPTLTLQSDLAKLPSLLAQKFPARSFTVETSIELSQATTGDEAGLAIVGRASATIAISRTASGNKVVFRDDSRETLIGPASSAVIRLRVRVSEGGRCEFAFAGSDGRFTRTPLTFQAHPGVWIGAKVGLYSTHASKQSGGHADFDHFRFAKFIP